MPSGSLHRLVYMSTAVGVLRAEELDRIYLRAQAANARAGISGLMLFYEGVFLQVLEGPTAGVTSLLEKIRRDRRHSGIVVLESGAVDERCFEGSPMHFVAARKMSPGEKQAFSDLRHVVSQRSSISVAAGLSDFLAAFMAVRPA